MKILIAEDEKLNAEHLVKLLNRIDPSLQVLAIVDSVRLAVKFLRENPSPDLLLFDIHLADGNSFDVFNEINKPIPVIFTTAFDEYAIRAFKVNSIDYLLKPVSYEDLKAAIEKAKRLTGSLVSPALLESISSALMGKPTEYKSRFLVKLGESISSVAVEEINFFIAEEGIVMLVKNDGRRFPVDYTLDQLEKQVDNRKFFRINRKVLLSISAISKATPYFNSRYKVHVQHLSDDESIISRERVSEFKSWLGE
ncbi:MAG: LytTR family DNA-binding domain-containing protein [Bacteroidia bacterium]